MNSNLLSFSHRKHTSVLHSHFIRSLAHNAFYHPHNAFSSHQNVFFSSLENFHTESLTLGLFGTISSYELAKDCNNTHFPILKLNFARNMIVMLQRERIVIYCARCGKTAKTH